MAHLLYGVENDEAIIMITGPIGSGKTMATHSFMDQLGDNFRFALITNTRINSRELLKLALDDLDVDYPRQADKSDLLILFKEFLIEQGKKNKRVVLVIDEAQNLSIDSLEEIRLLTNFGQGETQPVTVILVGQPELKEKVSQPELEQLRQRIRVHYHLAPLSEKELAGYIHHRMAIAGCQTRAFSEESIRQIFELSGGVPRVVNTLADSALLSAFVAERHVVLPEDVELPTINTKSDVIKPSGPLSAKDKRSSIKLVFVTIAIVLLFVLAGTGYVFRAKLVEIAIGVKQQGQLVVNSPPTQKLLLKTADRDKSPILESKTREENHNLVGSGTDVDSQNGSKPGAASLLQSSAVDAKEDDIDENSPTEGIGEEYLIHVSSFLTEDRADQLSRRLQDDSIGISVRKVEVNEQLWYRVYLGPFGHRQDAENEAQKMAKSGLISYFQIMKINSNGDG